MPDQERPVAVPGGSRASGDAQAPGAVTRLPVVAAGDRLEVVPEAVSATGEAVRLWHVVLTVGGAEVAEDVLRPALETLAAERGYLVSARYDRRRVELRYWEQAACLDDAAALALRLWGEHRTSAGLPPWQVVGLDVLDQETYQWRAQLDDPSGHLVHAGGVRPFG